MEHCECFERYEQKYLLNQEAYNRLRQELEQKMALDEYGVSQIYSVYFDTPDHRMIRNSLDKPTYKEKLRLRSYGCAAAQKPVFLELKKKFGGVVYKRRAEMPLQSAEAYLYHGIYPAERSQVLREVDYLRAFYRELIPTAWIGYTRVALYGLEDPNLRITFDWDLRWRDWDLHLGANTEGNPLLSPELRLMEIKLPGAMPMWMVRLFDALELYPTSFSKYGTAYQESVLQGAVSRRVQVPLPNGTTKGMIVCA